MLESGPVTQWLTSLKQGDREGVQQLWEAYYNKLVKRAENKLRGLPQKEQDAEDVALSAFKSFCFGVEQNRFPKLEDRDDLWQILLMLVRNKVNDLLKHEGRKKRDYRRLQHQCNLATSDESEAVSTFYDLLCSNEPDPQHIVALTEQLESLLKELRDQELCQVALFKLEGYTNTEIAEKIGRSLSTVERSLRLIRRLWIETSDSAYIDT